MIYKELEYRCETCNIELIVIDCDLSPYRKHVQSDLKKLSRHQRKGHKIIDIPRSIFYGAYGPISISDNDVITKYILENKIIIT